MDLTETSRRCNKELHNFYTSKNIRLKRRRVGWADYAERIGVKISAHLILVGKRGENIPLGSSRRIKDYNIKKSMLKK
jgi:hypothetical protein